MIAVTSPISAGESTANAILGELGTKVIDADLLVRDLQRRGEPGYLRIVDVFGDSVLGADGEIARASV
jgi:dephospho-CoA kinase